MEKDTPEKFFSPPEWTFSCNRVYISASGPILMGLKAHLDNAQASVQGSIPEPLAVAENRPITSPGVTTVNKAQLIEALGDRIGDKKLADTVIEELFDIVVRTVNTGEKVNITGFGVFEKRARAARTARNPRTGESVKVKKTTVPAFRPGTTFKEVVAGTRKLPRITAAKATPAAPKPVGRPRKVVEVAAPVVKKPVGRPRKVVAAAPAAPVRATRATAAKTVAKPAVKTTTRAAAAKTTVAKTTTTRAAAAKAVAKPAVKATKAVAKPAAAAKKTVAKAAPKAVGRPRKTAK
jgi:DNA-binding protein HU-beta